jgi:tyrosyl-tRNA synthetase
VLAGEIPTVAVPAAELSGLGLVDALVRSGLATSKGEARRGIQQKGFSINGTATDEVERTLTPDDQLPGGYVVLQKGKKNYAMLVGSRE